MQWFTDFVRKLTGRQPREFSPPPESRPVFLPVVTSPTPRNDTATRPTRRIDDHDQLKLHKAIDLAG